MCGLKKDLYFLIFLGEDKYIEPFNFSRLALPDDFITFLDLLFKKNKAPNSLLRKGEKPITALSIFCLKSLIAFSILLFFLNGDDMPFE